MEPEQVVGFQVDQDIRHLVLSAFVELADDVGPDVRGRRQDPQQIAPDARWKTAKPLERVHYSGAAVHVSVQPSSGHFRTG